MLHKDTPTLRHYMLMECTQPVVRLASWRGAKVWAPDTFERLAAVVPLPAIGVEWRWPIPTKKCFCGRTLC